MKLAGADRSAAMDAHDCSAGDKGETATMTKEQLQATVDQHSFVLNGIPYIFTFRWAANEGRWSRRYLLAVHVYSPSPMGEDVIYVHGERSTPPAELRRLLEDALVLHLAETSDVTANTA